MFCLSDLILYPSFSSGVFFYLQHADPATAKKLEFLPLVSLSVFIFFFSVGFGPIPWLMTAELMSPEVKERATAISSEYLLGWLVVLDLYKRHRN